MRLLRSLIRPAKQRSGIRPITRSLTTTAMADDEASQSDIEQNLASILDKIQTTYNSSTSHRHRCVPRLVAVSKTKPISLIQAAYRAGQRHFGENYIQELIEKASDSGLRASCPDIRWVVIGNVQSNKVNKLLAAPNLDTIETVTSIKLATQLNSTWLRLHDEQKDGDQKKLRVFVQVNTSGEDQKSGLAPSDAIECAKHITEQCDGLEFVGFMTIGALAHSIAASDGAGLNTEEPDNPDFASLISTRRHYCDLMSISDEQTIELSMGMSADFETAIRMGSSNVRVGSAIFGARTPKTKS